MSLLDYILVLMVVEGLYVPGAAVPEVVQHVVQDILLHAEPADPVQPISLAETPDAESFQNMLFLLTILVL